MTTSRFVRPTVPPGMTLTARDRAILTALRENRYMTTEQVHQLIFRGTHVRAAQARLRKLWAHRYLERHDLPIRFHDGRPLAPARRGPVYTLGRAGVRIVAAGTGEDPGQIERTLPRRPIPHLRHDLIVVGLSVALRVACRERADIELRSLEPESALRRSAVTSRQKNGRRISRYPVPDLAITLGHRPSGRTLTFYAEVVRADVRGGNKNLRQKLIAYRDLNRRGFFRAVYGHERLRAVLILTTSEKRAENFRRLAATLPDGRRLYWFGAYQRPSEGGPEERTLLPETILGTRWTDTNGERHSFTASLRPPVPVTGPAELPGS